MLTIYCTLAVLIVYEACSLKLPGPLVYVVTPSPRTPSLNEGRSAPFYYNNWMRRMDSPINATTSTTTPKVETPDLIFAEFESDNGGHMQKSIRKLLEKERIDPKPSTSPKPIYVPDASRVSPIVPEPEDNFALPKVEESKPNPEEVQNAMNDYFAMYNNAYNEPAPVYTLSSTTKPTTTSATVSTTSTTSAPSVENIWHIIDSEKYNQNPGNWEEITLNDDSSGIPKEPSPEIDEKKQDDGQIDENFALPGFATNPGPPENESRAIRTEPNFRFPYVNLKTFQMKPPTNSFSNNKKLGSNGNMFTSLDKFNDVKNPVRGEAQDFVAPQRQPIDRYNPAQPYLPDYGTKSKQSSPDYSTPVKSVSNLVPPPPPPPPPRASSNDLLPPTNYESFPPYAPSAPDSPPPPPPPAPKPSSVYQPPSITNDDDSAPGPDDDGPPMDLGYRYKPPSVGFVPTLPPPDVMSKPFPGYSYSKPSMEDDAQAKPFKGYSYDKPQMDDTPVKPFKGYSYKPQMDDAPSMKPYQGYSPPMDDSPPPMDKPISYGGYSYNKPSAPEEPPSYGPQPDHPPYPSHDSDYPDLIFDKPHGGKGNGGDDMKGDAMGMMPPPPPPPDMKPDMSDMPSVDAPDDHGFPHDFPGDFKYHDFDDHDHYHHHHHHTTTTTTTTETPRVNRYSYYYLGKKLYYLPLYFSVYFIVYVGALIIKAVLRHKIVYPNSWRPNDQTAGFFSKRSVDNGWDLSHEKLHEVTGVVTKALASAAEKYMNKDKDA